MKAQDLFTEEVRAIIKEHNVYDRLLSFLNKDKEVTELLNLDYMQLLMAKGKHSNTLISYVNKEFHGKKCKVTDNFKGEIEGVIEHLPTRMYNDSYTNSMRETANTVSFRREYENDKYDAPETLAFWVNTGDRYTTHLYTANNIELID